MSALAGVAFGGTQALADDARYGVFDLTEVRVGIADHDSGVFGNTKEEGPDVTLGLRFSPLFGDHQDSLWNPRPHVGANINTRGDTSAVFAALTFGGMVAGPLFINFDLGGAWHDGEDSTSRTDRKELGSPVLFYLAAEAGFRFLDHHGLALRLDHMSNASLADDNEGLDTVGVVYSYFF